MKKGEEAVKPTKEGVASYLAKHAKYAFDALVLKTSQNDILHELVATD